MKAYRPTLYSSIVILAIAAVVPLVTLRSFQGYVQAWFGFLGQIAPAALLVLLLILYRKLSPHSMRILTIVSMAIVSLGWLFGRVNILFFSLFLAGALAIILTSQRTETSNPNAPK